jgi:flagellar motor switch protein FliN/FliY
MAAESPDSTGISQNDIDALVASADAAASAAPVAPTAAPPAADVAPPPPAPPPLPAGASAPSLPQFDDPGVAAAPDSVSLLNDVELDVTIELGRTRMYVEDVLRLNEGAVVELDKLAGDPVDVYVNERLVARGEVLVLNDAFCVRVSEIVATDGDE